MTQDVVDIASEDIGEPPEKKVKVGTVLIQLQVTMTHKFHGL